MKANAFKVGFQAFKNQIKLNTIERTKAFLQKNGYSVVKKPKKETNENK